MKSVSELLKKKGNEVWSVRSENSVYDALKLMSEKNIGAVLVLDEESVAGIFSERDYARSVVREENATRTTPVKNVMSHEVLYVRPDQSIEDCMALMTEKHLRHLPVVEKDELVGLISIGDVVETIISKQGVEIKQLENWMTGREQFHRY